MRARPAVCRRYPPSERSLHQAARSKSLQSLASLLFLVLLGLSGCAASRGVTGLRLRWNKVGEGIGWSKDDAVAILDNIVYVGYEPRLLVIDDPLTISSLQDRVHPKDLERVACTDLSRFWVAVVYQGQKSKAGHVYSTRIRQVELDDSTVYIYAEFRERFVGQGKPILTPSPYYILRIRKPSGLQEEPSFVLNTGHEIVPRLCAIPGNYVPWEPVMNDPEAQSDYHESLPRLAIVQTPDEVPPDQPARYRDSYSAAELGTHFAIAAYQGEKATTNYSVEVIHVKQHADQVLICAQFITPLPGMMTGQAMTSPFYILRITRSEELTSKQTFLLLDNGTEVARKVAVIR